MGFMLSKFTSTLRKVLNKKCKRFKNLKIMLPMEKTTVECFALMGFFTEYPMLYELFQRNNTNL